MPGTTEPEPDNIPRHIAIIMDGNGRWAKQRGLPRVVGHKAGVRTVKRIVTAARQIGISVLTLYAFSTENWKRPAMEVRVLMALLKLYLAAERPTMLANNIILRCTGDIGGLPAEVQALLLEIAKQTQESASPQDHMVLNLALNYGGRDEIVMAARRLAEKCLAGELRPSDFSETLFSEHLYTAGLPDPDLVIRTGGEARLSNFLLWQASYAEMYFTEIKWPDFSREDLLAAICNFQGRERRFGKTGAQVRRQS